MPDCYDRKLEGEPHFTLLARDPQAPAVLRAWAAKRRVTDPDSAAYADLKAAEFETWRRENPRAWKRRAE